MEQKEVIEDDVLEKIAIALNIPIDTIRNYSDDATLNIIVNSLHDNSSIIQNYYPTFNTVDKLVELYEKLLETEKQKVTLLEEVLKSKK